MTRTTIRVGRRILRMSKCRGRTKRSVVNSVSTKTIQWLASYYKGGSRKNGFIIDFVSVQTF